MTDTFLFRNATLVDGTLPEARPGFDVLVEGAVIREVSDRPLSSASATIIDVGGRTLMPGLIDCHVHVLATHPDLGFNATLPNSLATLRSVAIMRDMLMRGFTTVRDAAGADFGLKTALEEGIVQGPRLFIAGRALSQTGGHGDYRGRFDDRSFCLCHARVGAIARVVDGIDAVRLAVREEIKAGADQIKIMASGGISSPTDPIHFLGYSRAEIAAVVDEAGNAGTYVMAHAYTAEAITRAVECGVRSVEHGNLVDPAAAGVMAKHGAIAVPTLVTYDALAEEGGSLGLPAESVAKIAAVRGAGLRSLEIFRDAGVAMAFGSDLLGAMHRHQSTEFVLRARILGAHAAIVSATSAAAQLLRMEGKLGVVAPGAFADLLIVDGNPLDNIELLTGQGRHLKLIMQRGALVKCDIEPGGVT